MTDELPPPMVPADADLRDFEYTPIFRAKLFGSTFHAEANDTEWRAGLTLWLKAMEQTPAGSLPVGDIALCRLAELGRDLKTWHKIKARALWKWTECSDHRLYHPTVSEVVNDSLLAKEKQRAKTLNARIASLKKQLDQASDDELRARVTAQIKALSQQAAEAVTRSVTGLSQGRAVTGSVTGSNIREGKGREGKGIVKGVASQPLSGVPPDGAPEARQMNGNVRQYQADARSILSLLNEKTGKRFPDTDTNVGIIVARMREGFSAADIRSVVAMKIRQWKDDPDKREYLRPKTLFTKTNFSNYVGELGPPDQSTTDDEPGITREREES